MVTTILFGLPPSHGMLRSILMKGYEASTKGFCLGPTDLAHATCVCVEGRGEEKGQSHCAQVNEQVAQSFLSPNEGLCFRCTHRADRTPAGNQLLVYCNLLHTLFPSFTVQQGSKWQNTGTFIMEQTPQRQMKPQT